MLSWTNVEFYQVPFLCFPRCSHFMNETLMDVGAPSIGWQAWWWWRRVGGLWDGAVHTVPQAPWAGARLDKRVGNCRPFSSRALILWFPTSALVSKIEAQLKSSKSAPWAKKLAQATVCGPACLPAQWPQLCFRGLGALGPGPPSYLPSQALWAGAQPLRAEAAHYFAAVDLQSEINWVSNLQASVWYRFSKVQ